jgi:hypothetical protein
MSQNPPGAAQAETVQTIQTAMSALERIRDQCNTVLNTLGPILATFNVPTAASYRTKQPIDRTKCVGRRLCNPDHGWSTTVYHEKQCDNRTASGSDLCITCIKYECDFVQMISTGTSYSRYIPWNGRITETPPDHTHMLGTKWSEGYYPRTKPCVWNGDAQKV